MRTMDIAYNLFTRYEQYKAVNHYPGLVALYGLAQLGEEWPDASVTDKAVKMLGRYPDHIDHPKYNFESYRIGGNGRAYLVLKGHDDGARELLRQYAEITMNAPVDRAGIQCMPAHPEKEMIWIDVVTATTPFMTMAGVALDAPQYIEYGAKQCFMMYDVFEDPENHLLHQARGFMADPKAISHDHWSRGNGWGIIGLADMVQFLPENHPLRVEAARRLNRHCEAIIRYQTKNGLWRQSMAEPLAWEESSGTGLIAYSMGVGLRMGVLDPAVYRAPFERAINGLVKTCINADFSTEKSCPGCLCPGEGDAKGTVQAYLVDKSPYRNENHSFGPLMLALVEAHRNGMRQVEWNKPAWKLPY